MRRRQGWWCSHWVRSAQRRRRDNRRSRLPARITALVESLRCHRPRRRRRRRTIQYVVTSVFDLFWRGVLDAPPEPVLGLAEGEPRGRRLTAFGMARAQRIHE